MAAYKTYLVELEKSPTNVVEKLRPGDCLGETQQRVLYVESCLGDRPALFRLVTYVGRYKV